MTKQQTTDFTLNVIKNLNKLELTATAKLVLVYLSTFYNQANKEFSLKQKKIIKTLGISERSVTRAMVELYAQDIIKKKPGVQNDYSFSSKFLNAKFSPKEVKHPAKDNNFVPDKPISTKQSIHIYIENFG